MSIEQPTADDYKRDLAADLEIQEAATEGPWKWIDSIMDGAYLAGPDGEAIINRRWSGGCGYTAVESKADMSAIANAGTNSKSWLRRAIAAEELILEWNESSAALADAPEGTTPATREALRRYDSAIGSMRSLAARIREGRRP